MPTVSHANLTGANLHEPKGVAAAAADKVYVSDGAGSGTWQKVQDGQMDSESATYGALITSDGASGAAYSQKVWKDLTGHYQEDVSGATRPTKALFRGTACDAWAFSVGDAIDWYFHLPHDYAVGTEIYIHTHWGHVGTNISGNLVWTCEATVAGRNASPPFATFSAPISFTMNSNTITGATMNLTNYPQYCHAVEEQKLFATSPSASQFNVSAATVDSVIIVHMAATTIPTITGGTTNEPFLLYVDLHYQADLQGTKNKDPNFYS